MAQYKVIINGRAGALIGNDGKSKIDGIRRAFANEGVDIDLQILTGDALVDAISAWADSETERLILGGGDGTVNTGASKAAAAGKILGILPMGTLNLYAQDLGIPLDVEEAVHALVQGDVREVDYAEINGHLFLCNTMLGILPPFMAQREHLRGASFLYRYYSLIRMGVRLLWRNPRFYVKLHTKDMTRKMKVRGIAVCNNQYHDAHSLLPHRATLDAGKLTVYLTRNPTRRGILLIALKVFLGTWQHERDIKSYETKKVTIATRRKRVSVVADGEILKLETPLTYKIVPRGLRVIGGRP
jgi:diacylglycerol kinase family enzyme